jgi:hypothetical protein
MSEPIYNQAVKEVLQELTGEPDKLPLFIQGIITSQINNIIVEANLLGIDRAEYFLQDYKGRINWVDAMVNTIQYSDSLYKKSYEKLKAPGAYSTTYGDLFTEIYEDKPYLSEIFVRIVEETEGVAITSAKQLQELTGITEIYGYWDEDKGETIPYGDHKPTKEEAQEIAFKQIKNTFTEAMSYRYSRALEAILEAGGKYSDLLQIKPSYFNLPETWSGCLATDQYSSILWALEKAFLIGEPNTSVRPDLKTIARDLEAPYSVLMDAHIIATGNTPLDRGLKQKIEGLENRLKIEVRAYISKQSNEWKTERLLLQNEELSQDKVEKQIQIYINQFVIWFNLLLFSEITDRELTNTDRSIIEAHKETIYKYFGDFLAEAKEIYNPHKK